MDERMTNKLFPTAVILDDFQFEGNELERLKTAADVDFSEQDTLELKLAFGRYLGATIYFHHSTVSTKARAPLAKTETAVKKLSDIFEKFWGEDDINALIIRSLGIAPRELAELSAKDQNVLGLGLKRSHAITDLNLIVGNLIDIQLGFATNNRINIADVLEILQTTLDSVKYAKAAIKGSGGNPGNPYFTGFLIDLLNCICLSYNKGPYDAKTVAFVEEARQIVAKRMKCIGESSAFKALTKLHADNMIGRIQDALDDDAKTYQRSRLSGHLTRPPRSTRSTTAEVQ
jgi:hypothetical protein